MFSKETTDFGKVEVLSVCVQKTAVSLISSTVMQFPCEFLVAPCFKEKGVSVDGKACALFVCWVLIS